MMVERMAIAWLMLMRRLSGVYSPPGGRITPGMRTKSTCGLNSKLPMIGEPERISTDRPGNSSTIPWAMASERRRCPSPNRSWL